VPHPQLQEADPHLPTLLMQILWEEDGVEQQIARSADMLEQ